MTRKYSGPNSFDEGVSGSSSQEFPQDVYDFTFPSQDSTRCLWSDPCSFSSSQESKQSAFLPPRTSGDRDDVFWKSKKVKMIDVDPEPYGSSSSQDLKGFGVLEISDEDFQKSKKLKKAYSDPYEYNSSEELEEIVVLPQRKGRENGVFDFSEQGDLWKTKKSKNVGSDTYVLNSSQELRDLEIPQSRKCDSNGHCLEFDGVSGKSKKKDRAKNGVLQKKKKKNRKSKESGPGYVELTTTLMETQEFGEMMEHVDEVNFALDGLKKGQQVRIRRASLISLLSICGTLQQRRLLRAHGYFS